MRSWVGIGFLVTIAQIFVAQSAFAADSTVQTKIIQNGKDREVEFVVQPPADYVINLDKNTRWQIKFSEVKGAKLTSEILKQDALIKELPGFKVKFLEAQKTWSAKYQLIAFVCTKDKKLCERHDIRGEVKES